MKALSISKVSLACTCLLLLLTYEIDAQTKRIKRPRNRVGITSVDNFVRESFDLYDKVYRYDGYAQSGQSLEDEDIDVLEDALDDLTLLSDSAPDIIDDLDGAGVLKQGKATLQINRAKKALSYSIKTAKELLLGERTRREDQDNPEEDQPEDTEDSSPNNDSNLGSSDEAPEAPVLDVSDGLEAYSKFDFVPGDKLLYYDDFSQDFIGDFPSKWNTNGSGEVVKLNKVEGKWFELKSGYNIQYIPLLASPLPEDYTIEFDFLIIGLDNKTSSSAKINIILADNNGFNASANSATAFLPIGQYGAFKIGVTNKINSKTVINSRLTSDIRKAVRNSPHISIAVNKRRFRLWVNETKYIDIPQLIAPDKAIGYLKFNVESLKDGNERLFIRNIKVAEGGVDLRRKLMSEGRISTNGILFESGSAKIQPQSLGIVRQISQVLMQDESIKLNIIGHTDSDGSNEANLKLSKSRAAAVKEALVSLYDISADRLTIEGKGESEPVEDNVTADGKAKNRRVEFVVI